MVVAVAVVVVRGKNHSFLLVCVVCAFVLRTIGRTVGRKSTASGQPNAKKKRRRSFNMRTTDSEDEGQYADAIRTLGVKN